MTSYYDIIKHFVRFYFSCFMVVNQNFFQLNVLQWYPATKPWHCWSGQQVYFVHYYHNENADPYFF